MKESEHVGQSLSAGAGQAGFIFSFVSVAYGVVVTAVFPMLYESVRQLKGQFVVLPAFEYVVNSRDALIRLSPFIDKVCLAVALVYLWFLYYWLIAGYKTFSGLAYAMRALVVDLGCAVLLFFAIGSIGNFDEKVVLEQDTTWLLLMASGAWWLLRFWNGVRYIQVPAEARRRFQLMRWLMDMCTANFIVIGCIAIGFVGYRYDRSALDIESTLFSLSYCVGICAAFLAAVLAMMHVVARESRHDPFQAEFWNIVIAKQRHTIFLIATVLCVAEALMIAYSEELFPILLRVRNVVPWSTFLVLLLAVGALASLLRRMWIWGHWRKLKEIRRMCEYLRAFIEDRSGESITVVHALRGNAGQFALVCVGPARSRKYREEFGRFAEHVMETASRLDRDVKRPLFGAGLEPASDVCAVDWPPDTDSLQQRTIVGSPTIGRSRSPANPIIGGMLLVIGPRSSRCLNDPIYRELVRTMAQSLSRFFVESPAAPTAAAVPRVVTGTQVGH